MKAITTKYFGPTNNRGSRIKASDGDGNTLIVGYDHAAHNPHDEAAIALCRKMRWYGRLVKGSLEHGYVYVWADKGAETLEVTAEVDAQ